MERSDFSTAIYKDLDMEEAMSHRIHSRIFEILGYIDMLDRSRISEEDHMNLIRIEDLCKTLINEVHTIIDYYKNS